MKLRGKVQSIATADRYGETPSNRVRVYIDLVGGGELELNLPRHAAESYDLDREVDVEVSPRRER